MKLRPDTRGLSPSSSRAGSYTAPWQADPTRLPSTPLGLILHVPWPWPMLLGFPEGSSGAQTRAASWDTDARGTISDQDGTHKPVHSESCQPWVDTRGTTHFHLVLSLPHSLYNSEGGTGLPTVFGHGGEFFCTGSFW